MNLIMMTCMEISAYFYRLYWSDYVDKGIYFGQHIGGFFNNMFGIFFSSIVLFFLELNAEPLFIPNGN